MSCIGEQEKSNNRFFISLCLLSCIVNPYSKNKYTSFSTTISTDNSSKKKNKYFEKSLPQIQAFYVLLLSFCDLYSLAMFPSRLSPMLHKKIKRNYYYRSIKKNYDQSSSFCSLRPGEHHCTVLYH